MFSESKESLQVLLEIFGKASQRIKEGGITECLKHRPLPVLLMQLDDQHRFMWLYRISGNEIEENKPLFTRMVFPNAFGEFKTWNHSWTASAAVGKRDLKSDASTENQAVKTEAVNGSQPPLLKHAGRFL